MLIPCAMKKIGTPFSMRIRSISCALLLLLSASINCTEQNLLEYEFVLSFKQVESVKNGRPHLKITGHLGHSALTISKIETKTAGNTLVILAYLRLVAGGAPSVPLAIDLDVPDQVDTVLFGKKEYPIWKRK